MCVLVCVYMEREVRALSKSSSHMCLSTLVGVLWRSHLTSALGAVIHGPLVSVLANDAIVDTDTTVNSNVGFNKLVFIRLRKRETRKINLQ